MLLSQTIGCASKFGEFKSIELIADAGFDAVDYTMSPMKADSNILNTDGYKQYSEQLKATAESFGVRFNQAHAVSFIKNNDPEVGYNILVQRNIRAIEVASILGAETIVVHPLDFGGYIGNEEEVFHKNIKYFKSLLPYAERFGVKIACENMWCGDRKRGVVRGSVCSNPYEHAHYVDAMNSEMFAACLDVGHSSLAGREAQDCIRTLGNRLQALHIHDNDYRDDMHTLPGLSEMDWNAITGALAEINYNGDFTLETNHFFDSLDTVEEAAVGLKLSALIGRKMIAKIDECKNK